ncbi:hypothetical protein TEA_007294 [Camellia sinensis var. sinensis]|uniref:Disease resistance R13L4/SHOC-2-like LRR domain-containing protein n=1 Tax=Camellia sinensis var. sinensis TaxID=542762 RepID=A0A4S4D4Y8_CAMSN|nr:hypothetical protein TEA_007294 [Camellia sinensis var. sinensis]
MEEENSSFNDTTRRLSMHMHYCSMDKVMESIIKSPVHAIFLFQMGELPKKPLLGTLAANFKLLKTLDLQDAPLDQLHEEVGNLFLLRYLSIRNTKGGIGGLEELQSLWFVETNDGLIKELEKLRQLRKLGITKLEREHGRALCAAIEKMIYLKHLSVWASGADEILDLQYISSPPQYLPCLELVGHLEKLPE